MRRIQSRLIGYALFGLLLVALATSAARCYPPGTGVVVFLQGLYMELDENGTHGTLFEEHQFGRMKEVFVENGYEQERLLDYSYNGGEMTPDGAWAPEHFGCADTDRPVLDSVAVLEKMLREYREHHPRSHFILVGHSLGGYIAFLAGARDATRPAGERLEISAVVTLDAPLHGVSADKKFVIDLIRCEKTFLAGGDLVVAGADPSIRDIRRYQAAVMAHDGVRLATIGNTRDCLYNTVACTGLDLVDDSQTQFIDSAALVREYEISTEVFGSHDVIVSFGPAIEDVVGFAGPGSAGE